MGDTFTFANNVAGMVHRGDYLRTGGSVRRVVGVHSSVTLTMRPVDRWYADEWFRARLEDWVIWPIRDLFGGKHD